MQYTQRLEDLRKDRDLTQEQVAKLLNLKREQYRAIRNRNKRSKSRIYNKKYANYITCSADYLLCFTNGIQTTTPKNSQFFCFPPFSLL